MAICWVYNDGGRAAAGYKGPAGDCGVRAICIATGLPYRQVYKQINVLARAEKPPRGARVRSSARNGIFGNLVHQFMASIGWRWVATMEIGSGCRMHVDAAELPQGALVLRLSKHYAAVVDGVLYDTYDSSREGTRAVYGYWTKA